MTKKTIIFILILLVGAAAGLYGLFSTDGTAEPEGVQSISFTEESILDQDETELVNQEDVPQSIAVSSDAEFGAAGSFTSAALSPDGDWIAFTTSGAAHGGGWLYEVESGQITPAAFQYGGSVEVLEWSPDGRYIVFAASTPAETDVLVLVDRDDLQTYVQDTSLSVSVSAEEGMSPPFSYDFLRWEAPHTLCFSFAGEEHCIDAADDTTTQPSSGEESDAEERVVELYYYSADQDTDDQGNVMCSADGLVSVERSISEVRAPLARSIELLLEGSLTDDEEAAGITTEFPLAGFSLEGASISDGVATLEFADPNNSSSGGSCRVSILQAQIEATATQFETVDSVQIIPEVVLQP